MNTLGENHSLPYRCEALFKLPWITWIGTDGEERLYRTSRVFTSLIKGVSDGIRDICVILRWVDFWSSEYCVQLSGETDLSIRPRIAQMLADSDQELNV